MAKKPAKTTARKTSPRNRSTAKSIHDERLWTGGGGGRSGASMEVRRRPSVELNATESRSLSIAVHRAVDSIARNISQAKMRLFNRNGREITGGPLFNLLSRPAPFTSWRKFCYDTVTFWNTYGEYFIALPKGDVPPTWLRLLHPKRMSVHQPQRPNSRRDVTQWRYNWNDGTTEYIRDDMVVFDAMFNPDSGEPIRGLSPLTTGAVMVTSSYHASKYNANFFENSAIPSHILVVSGGVSRQVRQDLERRYLAEHGTYSNAHKTFVVSGVEDAKFLSLEQPFQEGAFMEVQKWADMKVGQLYGVPAIEMGFYDKTRFDTAAEERKLFAESTLAPQAERLSEAIQLQLIDPFFSMSDFTTEKPDKATMSKSLDAAFEKARFERNDPPIVCLIDIDTLPIMGAVKAAAIEQAMKFRDTLLMSPQEVADYFNIDIPDGREERKDIYAPQTHRNITHPEKNPDFYMQSHAMAQQEKQSPGSSGGDAAKPSAEDRAKKRVANRYLRKLRGLTLATLDEGRMWSLTEARLLAGDDVDGLHKLICRTYLRIGELMKQHKGEELKELVKDYFNHA